MRWIYPSYIHLYLFLTLVYLLLSLSISLAIQIRAYLFQSRFLYLCLFFVYPPIFFQSLVYPSLFLYTSLSIQINSYLFVNPNSRLIQSRRPLSLSFLRISTFIYFYLLSIHLYFFISHCQSRLVPISLSIQLHGYIFQTRFLYICLFYVYPPIFVSISCLSPSIFYTTSSIQINAYLFLFLSQSKFTAIYFKPVLFISLYSFYIRLHLFLSLVYPPLFFIPLRQSRLMPISFYFLVNPNSRLYISNPFYLSHSILFISAYICFYLLSIHLCLFIPLFQSRLIPISLSIRIHASFNPVFFISVFSSYIHLYLFLSLAYPSLFLYTSLSIQIHGYIFQTCFPYLCLFFVYPPIFVSISCISISICLYLFVNPEWCLSLSISLSIQIHASFKPVFFISVYSAYIHLYFFQSLVYPSLSLYTSLSIQINAYLFVNPNSRLYLLNPFSLSLSILRIFTYICFYLLFIHLYFIISLCQSRWMPISFNPIFCISA